MPVAYIIPGFRETEKNPIYPRIAREFKKYGVQAKIVTPTWERHTMSEYIEEVFAQLPHQTTSDYILGFSFGAYISLALTSKKKFKYQFLCSLSPYFKEYASQIKKSWWKSLGLRRSADLRKFRLGSLGTSVYTPTSLLVGSTEGTLMTSCTEAAKKLIPAKTRLRIVHEVGHKIRDPRYFTLVQQEIAVVCKK